ncbi:MAG: SH3 domain-containing protein, partial [Anaerolineae bacterium]|nr:SH3 domain-containing protein [Anaerolineae bacterium]
VPVVDGVVSSAPVPQYTGVRGRVTGNLRIREQPTTASAKIGLMPWGTEIDLYGKNAAHDWYMVSYEGIVGWSYAPWIEIIEGSLEQLPYMDGTSPIDTPLPATQGVIVQAYGNVRIRNGPGLDFPKIGLVPWGTRVQLLARSSDGLWYKIQHGVIVGWSYQTWYRPVQGDPTTVPVSDQ